MKTIISDFSQLEVYSFLLFYSLKKLLSLECSPTVKSSLKEDDDWILSLDRRRKKGPGSPLSLVDVNNINFRRIKFEIYTSPFK